MFKNSVQNAFNVKQLDDGVVTGGGKGGGSVECCWGTPCQIFRLFNPEHHAC